MELTRAERGPVEAGTLRSLRGRGAPNVHTRAHFAAQRVTDWRGTDRPTVPPQWVLDKLADEQLTGRYDCRKRNICGSCFTARSVNGVCGCE